MVDPVVCVDGFSYERTHLEEWFHTQSSALPGSSPNYTSPMTGQVLASTVMIPNSNLARAIEFITLQTSTHIVRSDVSPKPQLKQPSPQYVPTLQFSPFALGKCVTLADSRNKAIRTRIHTDTAAWYECIAFSSLPARITVDQKPRVTFKVGKCKTGWGGLTVGLSPIAPDRIQVPELTDFVDANCWWLDANRWFHTPETGTTLVPWSTDALRPGDEITLHVPEPGRLCVYMNGVKKLDLKDTGIPLNMGSQLYGFVALTGGYEEVTMTGDQSSLDS